MTLPNPDSSPQSSFSRDVLTLVTGTTFAQIITILSAPVITRLYGPEAFGILSIFTAIISIFSVFVCLRYELAIVLPKSNEEAANVFGLCILILLFISIVSIPFLWLSQKSLEQLLNVPQLGQFLWLIPPSILLSGTYLALNYWNTRTKQFHRLAIAQVTRSCATTGTQLGMGFIGYTSGGVLIIATLIGQLVLTLTLGMQTIREHLRFFKQNITLKGMNAVLKQYINFPKYDLWSALLNTIGSSLPTFILSIYFNSAILGYYSLCLMVLGFPLGLIGNAIGQVFFQNAAEAKNISQTKLSETVEKVLKPLIVLAYFPTIIFVLIGPELFGVVFGVGWQESGVYARYLSFWIAIVFIAAPISTLFSIFQKQKIGLIFNFIQMVSRVIALLIGAIMGNVLIAIILFAIVGCISNLIPLLYFLKLSDVSILKTLRIFFNYFLLSVPFIIIILFIQYLSLINDIGLVIFSFIVTILYYFLAIKNDPELIILLKEITSQIPIIKKYLN